MSMTLLERAPAQSSRLGIVDCDIHPAMRSPATLAGYLPERWRAHLASFGMRAPNPFAGAIPYPRMLPGGGSRADSFPPNGGPPASDLDFFREQHLDPYNIEHGMLQPLAMGSHSLDLDLGAALCRAVNDWQLDVWCHPEPRLKAAICIAQDDPDAALDEIARRAGDRHFAQIAIPPRCLEPLGRRRYWPIYAAAAEAGLPIGMHSAAVGAHSNSATGWHSYYIEEHYAFANSLQAVMVSMVMEGVFERFPGLKVVLIEGGFAWVPALAWRLDRAWERNRAEIPQVKRPPSDYIREHFWYTTQPVEEPENPRHILDTIRWIGADRLMFSTDYPHWDFDDPRFTFKLRLPEAETRAIFRDNAKALYRLD